MERGILAPVQLSSSGLTLFSVEIRVPSPVSDELSRYAAEDGITWETAVTNALIFYRESFMTPDDHARENAEWMIRNIGPPKQVKRLSPKEHEQLRQKIDDELSQLRTNGELGNLVLPEEVYRFVVREIESGAFASPTDILEAAMPSFHAHRHEPPRADFVWSD